MPHVNGKFYSSQQIREIKRDLDRDEFEEFMISGVIGAVTGSSIVGGLLGGSFTGGLLGDLLEGDDDSIF